MTKVSPFIANSGLNPRAILDPAQESIEFNNEIGKNHAGKMRRVFKALSLNLEKSKMNMKERFDKSHINKSFKVGDRVILRTGNTNLDKVLA